MPAVVCCLCAVVVLAHVEPSRRSERISVTALVHRVLGPRLFTISGTDRLNGHSETLVFVPAPGLARVRAHTTVTVTGTLRRLATAELANEWGWRENGSATQVDVDGLMIVADPEASTGTDVTVDASGRPPSSTDDDTVSNSALTSVNELAASADAGLVGRIVTIRNARINAVVSGGGFWNTSNDEQLFVLPADDARVLTAVARRRCPTV
jgi:hypothetical protein